MLVLSKAIRIPGYGFGESTVNGFFANQVCTAFEIKTGISSSMPKIITKTWECHRLKGGLSTGRISESIDGEKFIFNFDGGVPLFVIGNKGFKTTDKYLDHFNDFDRYTYRVNKEVIDKPTDVSQVIPDLLLDFTEDTLLVKDSLKPEIIANKIL
jgi:hypothetical protein